MASLLDISLLNQFSNIFVILFVFTATYAVLVFKSPFGSNKGLNAMMAAMIALVFIFSNDAIEVIKATIPWYIIIMIALMFIYMIIQSIGTAMPSILKNDIGTWILIIGIGILALNVSLRIGQTAGPFLGNESINSNNVVANGEGDVGSQSYSQNLGATLFHPRVLGFILVLLVAVFSVIWIGKM
jgi:hypothetical protein